MLTPEQIAEHTLKRGSKYPYDAPDKWWDGDGENPPTPLDWAHHAARGYEVRKIEHTPPAGGSDAE